MLQLGVYQGLFQVVAESAHETIITMIDPTQTGSAVSVPFVAGGYYMFNAFLGPAGPYALDLVVPYY